MQRYDEYWHTVREEVAAADRDWDRQPQGRVVEAYGLHWRLDWIRFSSVEDQLIWGWYCVPEGHPPRGNSVLWLPGYSYGTSPPDRNSLVPGAVVMSINVHGNLPDASYINPSGVNDYIATRLDDPDRYIYRRIAAHCLRALDVLQQQPEVDAERVVTSGMSQGGMLALIVAAQEPQVRACFADMPFLSDVEIALKISNAVVYRHLRAYLESCPDGGRSEIETLKLFDPATHAPRITCPVWLSAGGRDPSVKARTVETVYARLAATYKEYQLFQKTGHDFTPEMGEVRRRWFANCSEIADPNCDDEAFLSQESGTAAPNT